MAVGVGTASVGPPRRSSKPRSPPTQTDSSYAGRPNFPFFSKEKIALKP